MLVLKQKMLTSNTFFNENKVKGPSFGPFLHIDYIENKRQSVDKLRKSFNIYYYLCKQPTNHRT